MYTNEFKSKDEILIMKMISKYAPYWPVFLGLLILTGAAAGMYLKTTRPLYEANASLIIKDEKKGNEDSKFMESLNLINSKKIIENEIEVLQSRSVLKEVVNKLHIYARVYQKEKIRDQYLYEESPFQIELLNPEHIKANQKKASISINNKGMVVLDQKHTYPFENWVHTPWGDMRIRKTKFKNPDSIQHEFYVVFNDVSDCIKQMQARLKVTSTNKLSSVIDLKYRDMDPVLAENILDELIASYNQTSLHEKNQLAKNTLTFIEDRLNAVGADLLGIEKRIQQYKSSAGAVDISTQGQLFLQNVSQNDQKLSDLNLQISVMNQLERQVNENGNISGIVPSTWGINDANMTQLINTLNQTELEREKLKKTVAENNPMLISIADQIKKIKSNIQENIVIQRKNLEESKRNIYATNSGYNDMLHSIPAKERELLEISREQNIKNGIYSFLLQKREESELSYASTISDTRIVDHAHAGKEPVSPNKLYVLGFALFAVIGFPISIIGAREVLNSSILYRSELEEATQIPIWGEIAMCKNKNSLNILPGERSYVAEEFRRIRYTIRQKLFGAEKKTILVTSSISGEGKSFFAAHLAASYALTGKKVLLIDMDMHNASLDKIFSITDAEGVTDILQSNMQINDVAIKIPDFEHLNYLSSGTFYSDPSALLDENQIAKFIKEAKETYDVVVIDSPPVNLVTDSYLISGFCDVTLYMVRHSYTPKNIVHRLDQTISMNPLHNMAIIFNGVRSRGFSQKGYGYGYVYGGDKRIKKGFSKNIFKQTTV